MNKQTVAKLELGKTNDADVVKIFGSPKDTDSLNESGVQSVIYLYHDFTTGNVGPVVFGNYYWLAVETRNGTVTGYLYLRSDGANATHFDKTKIDQLVDGQTTKTDAIALLGVPYGRAALPSRIHEYLDLNQNPGADALVWTDAEPIHGVFAAGVTHIDVLRLQFDTDGRLLTKSVHNEAVTPAVYAH